MKIEFQCPICQRLKRFSKNPNIDIGYTYQDLTDNSIIDLHCYNGHDSVTIIENLKFDLLFESGISAFKDGYKRESVTSVAASLERFYEFSIRIILENASIDDHVLANSWKNVSSQSERQLGAFIFLFALKFETTPPLLNNKMIQFRNSIIHKGYFPSKEESLLFLKNASEIIQKIFRKLEKEMSDSVENLRTKILDNKMQVGQNTINRWRIDYPHLSIRPGINDLPKLTTLETFLSNLFQTTELLDIDKYLTQVENYS